MYGQGNIGKVLKDKTQLTTYTPLDTMQLDGVTGWLFHPGTYDITFNEGCKIPDNRVAFIKQRSSLWRNGTLINSPVFDPGFETEFMGTIMLVTEPIFIEENARVAQIYFHECLSAELYNGQWQNDKQRASI
jgi:deoxycytidine triphosphate deaminase